MSYIDKWDNADIVVDNNLFSSCGQYMAYMRLLKSDFVKEANKVLGMKSKNEIESYLRPYLIDTQRVWNTIHPSVFRKVLIKKFDCCPDIKNWFLSLRPTELKLEDTDLDALERAIVLEFYMRGVPEK